MKKKNMLLDVCGESKIAYTEVDVECSDTNSDTDFAAEKFMTLIRVKSGILINHLMYFEVVRDIERDIAKPRLIKKIRGEIKENGIKGNSSCLLLNLKVETEEGT
ncbi:hypothetical protein HGM15179_016896 [Zosterops borbonicus]|uniref:Uncharacterized protein n=1 Tax=Zosterops borbonicus TaxID=364589 RepID=A0A8K1G1U9_9PASS|nr:hypothetical protein HGM15179_016896 [Zosterops borbonicus]